MILFISLILIFFPYIPTAEALPRDEIVTSGESCVWFQGYRSSGRGRATLQFFNACGKSRYINVCLIDAFGDTQLLRSASRVPSAGKIEFYPFIERRPSSISWTAARHDPPIPAPCL